MPILPKNLPNKYQETTNVSQRNIFLRMKDLLFNANTLYKFVQIGIQQGELYMKNHREAAFKGTFYW